MSSVANVDSCASIIARQAPSISEALASRIDRRASSIAPRLLHVKYVHVFSHGAAHVSRRAYIRASSVEPSVPHEKSGVDLAPCINCRTSRTVLHVERRASTVDDQHSLRSECRTLSVAQLEDY